MKITGLELHILLAPDYDPGACSSAQDDLIVEVRTDEGIVGIGETDTNPWVARECIRARGTHCMGLGLQEMLLGADPMQPEAVWETLYRGSKMTGRRGALICALGAIDTALWDIKAQTLGVPLWKLLGGNPGRVTPYASLLPTGRTIRDYADSLVAKVKRTKSLGYRAAKLEVCVNGPYSHNGLQEPDDVIVEIVAECRNAVGPDLVLMVDVAYAWPDPATALGVIERLAPFGIEFIETPIDIDDLEGYAFLQERSPIPIAAGEWQNTHFEFLDLADRGKVDVLQPDVGRVGGITEALKVCRIAADRGRKIVPHCWKSGLGIAASAHLASATEHCPYIEFLPLELAESPLRRELLVEDFRIVDGQLELPTKPGLGVDLNREALRKYRVDERV
ncbi:mandelate racemase/muconate lactonizing enzyme family protein [Tundrisphaera lichenicola]|uniref:mandelate racemase/muconate lactonizing enzyme family protein n=1 Tax=Tundrisphaera lichenicola TaxID=2029860 RepID=UPI003EB70E44